MRGGEKVLEAILELVPHAGLYTLFHRRGSVSEFIEARRIVTSPLDRLAEWIDYRKLLPLFPAAIRSFDLAAYDLVISSSHAVAHGVRRGRAAHVVYCHTPMRYIWDRFDDYFPRSRPLARTAAGIIAAPMRRWDVNAARRAGRYVANSSFVARRIETFYGRGATVVEPYVDGRFLEVALHDESKRGDHHVVVSALVPYKKIEEAIDACSSSGRKLVVVGSGPMLSSLKNTRSGDIELRGWVAGEELIEIVRTARSLIMPGVEDFGITALEALALGTPVVTVREGGAIEAVGECGVAYEGGVERLVAALDEVERRSWPRASLRERAALFSKARFQNRLSAEIDAAVEEAR